MVIPNPVKLRRIAKYFGDRFSLSLSFFRAIDYVYAILFSPWINPSWLIARLVAFEELKLFFFFFTFALLAVIDLARYVSWYKLGREF